MPKFVELTLDAVLNSTKDKEQTALFELLLFLREQGTISSEDLLSGLATYTVQLEDLRCAAPLTSNALNPFTEGDRGQAVPVRCAALQLPACVRAAPSCAHVRAMLCPPP